ncbi:hypothetical protein DRH13_04375 [Candidatus Woesebacteria bacterium]|nr:MAG: hypothetical protein DRH13_04375 [Candidatus Woesebacteria bacterium]
MIERSKIVEVVGQAIRDVQTETGLKVDLSKAILLIDQGVLENTLAIPEIMGFKIYSAGYISHIAEVMIAFPEESTEQEGRFIYKFIEAMQAGETLL